MDWTLQKATELGAAGFIPLQSARSVVRISGERETRKVHHWQSVVLSACEQCGRNRVPEVASPMEFHDWLGTLGPDGNGDLVRLLLDPEGAMSMGDLPETRNILMLVGPEGGLAPHEADAARQAGFRSLRLGPRILRTETAPLAAMTVLQARFGDLG